MQRMFAIILFLATLAFHAESRASSGPKEVKKAALTVINPKLEDVSSDKKFFGPPFPADYPSDERPTMKPDILKELKENNKPYPYLQSRNEYDADYVKDENSDKGDWKAQFDYDAYRKLLGEEEERARRAQEDADKEGRDEANAQKGVDDADKDAKDAQKDLDDAKNSKDGDSGDGPGGDGLSAEEKKKLEDLKKKVKEAEDNYEKAKKQFEECQRQLEAAEKEVEDLKKELKEYEDYVFSQSQLWAVKKEADKKVRATKKEAAAAAVKLAQAKLDVSVEVRKEKEESLAKEKAENDVAQKNLQMHVEKMEKVKQELEKAKLHLWKLRGYKVPSSTLAKSGAVSAQGISSVLLLVLAFVAAQFL
jgi:hypothetical protein